MRKSTIRSKLLFPTLLLLPLAGYAESAEERCIREVFGDFCLGGSMNNQLTKRAIQREPQQWGERSGVIYSVDRDKIYVMAFKGTIYKVLRTYEPATQVAFKDFKRRLQGKYGKSVDQSQYPTYVRSTAGKIGAIRRGEATGLHVWQLEGEPWRVELGWSRKLGISVAYLVNSLDLQQQMEVDKGL